MVSSINALEALNQEAIVGAFSQVKDWLGRGVNWIQSKNQPIHLQDPRLAGLTVCAADLLIFYIAFRIANLWNSDNNHAVSWSTGSPQGAYSKGNSFQIGKETLICYSLGVFALSRIIKVPFSTPLYVGLHVGSFIGGCVLLQNLSKK